VSAVEDAAGRVAGSVFDAVDYFPRLTQFGTVFVGLLERLTNVARNTGSPFTSMIEEAYEAAAQRLDALRGSISSNRG
jgi:hypothetical protein